MYSKVSKYSPEARKRMAYRSSRGKGCGYYMRIVFFFSSLIQSLIIVSLVLFLVYGGQHDSASVARVQDLEVRFSQLSLETVNLRLQRKNLTHLLNVTTMEKARHEYDLHLLRASANISYLLLDDTQKKLQTCLFERNSGRVYCAPEIRQPVMPFPQPGCNCGMQMETLRAKMELIRSNFTQTAMQMQMEMDQIARDRDNLNLEAIQLRRDKSVHEKAIQYYQIRCKEEFVNSLSGISNVSKAFLGKIDSLFHALSPFHLTCPKQKEYLDQIRLNCTDLSEEVVSKFQTYLDRLGSRVSMYQGNISVLTAENLRLTRDYNLCSQNRSGLIREHRQHLERNQLRHDDEKEKLLKEKRKLSGDIVVLQNSVILKDSQLHHMGEQLKLLNLSCIPRTGFPRLGSQPNSPWGSQLGSSNQGLGSQPSGPSQFNRFGSSSSSSSSSSSLGSPFGSSNTNTGLGSSNTGFNKPSSGGLGSSSSLGSSNSFGSSSSNKFGSSNQGSSSSSSSSFGSPFGSSSSGTGVNKPSTGLGSSSSAFGSSFSNPSSSSSSKFGSSSGTGSNFGSSSSNQGSNFGSSSSNLGSSSNSGLGSSSSSSLSKTTSNSRGSSSNSFFGSSSSSSSSSLGSSSSSQSKLSPSLSNKGSSSSSSGSSSSSSSSSGSSATPSKSFGSWWGGLGTGSSSSSSSTTNSNSNNADQSKLGSSQGRGTSNTGSSFGSFGSGRTNSFSFTGPISVNQHLRDLQRIINPPAQEEKQELSRIMG